MNMPETLPFDPAGMSFPVVLVENSDSRGFGANHHAAASRARGEFFCVLNRDIRFAGNPVSSLLQLVSRDGVVTVSPLVVGPDGKVEDHAREFPSFSTILKKVFLGARSTRHMTSGQTGSPDWIAGMFMLFRLATFRRIGEFDDRYFLYYKDVDLYARLRLAGYDIRVDPGAGVVHHAHRTSYKSPRYLLWHVTSLLRFLLSGTAERARRARDCGSR